MNPARLDLGRSNFVAEHDEEAYLGQNSVGISALIFTSCFASEFGTVPPFSW
jgi:hypothetical protein